MLKILTVGYNEEQNLEKLYESLSKFIWKIDCQFFYVDQESTDNSIDIAKKYWAEIFLHKNKGYADPDKKWLVENVCNDNDWCLILDADFYFSDELILEIVEKIKCNKFDVYNITRTIIFLWKKWITIHEPLLFKKNSVKITNDIHKYYTVLTDNIWKLTNHAICDDLKEYGESIWIWINRVNKYTTIEAKEYKILQKYKIITMIFMSPIIWFFGYWILHKQFIRWIPWLINCLIQSVYRVSLYAKIYEIQYINNK